MVDPTNGTQQRKRPYLMGDNEKDKDIIIINPSKLEHKLIMPIGFDSIENSDTLAELDSEIRKKLKYLAGPGTLISGLPGTGKTVLILKLALDYQAKIIQITKGMTTSMIEKSFEVGRKKAERGERIFMIMDEIDEFGSKRDQGMGEDKISCLGRMMDGIKKNPLKNFYSFAISNYPERIDRSLLRPGRLEEHFRVPLPNLDIRKKIIEGHYESLERKIIEEHIIMMANGTRGFTPADLRGVLKKVLLFEAVRQKDINPEQILKIVKNFEPSIKRGFKYFQDPQENLEDVCGRERELEYMKRIVTKEKSANFLMFGPRGTGKTMAPEALAMELDYNFIKISGGELEDSLVGQSTKNAADLFERAQAAKPCFIVFDEIKGLVQAKRSTMNHKDDVTAYIDSKLARPMPGVFNFAQVNNPLELTTTTLSRFPHKLFFGLPERKGREAYIDKFLNWEIGDLKKLVYEKTEENSFRDLSEKIYVLNDFNRLSKESDKVLSQDKKKYLVEEALKKVPENTNCEENWEYIIEKVGDSMQLERIAYDIFNK